MNYYYDCEVLGDRIDEVEELIKESNIMDNMLEGRNRVVSELENDFAVLNICDVWDWYKVTMGIDIMELDWAGECNHILKFCENFRLYLYEKPKEDFFEWEGIEKAKGMGFKGVILSSLS
jgi:hypothetical protein